MNLQVRKAVNGFIVKDATPIRNANGRQQYDDLGLPVGQPEFICKDKAELIVTLTNIINGKFSIPAAASKKEKK